MDEPLGTPGIEPGEIVGEKFRIGRVLGRGGMSVVYEAQHVQLGQRVAVKVLGTLQAAARGAFARALLEAQASARLTSEHVVKVFDVGTTKAGHAYVVMEKLIGHDLAHDLRQGAPSSIAHAVQITLQACHALAEAHASGIVHRDIKPSNIFLSVRPDRVVTVKVLDFGLARADSRSAKAMRTATPFHVAGSPGYASPEQLGTAGDVDARADIWALGVVLYQVVAGRRPFEAANLADALIAASTLPLPPLTNAHGPVPPHFESIVRRCLEKDRENRFASVLELAEALGPYAPPAFAHYPDRIRDFSKPDIHSAGTMRITLVDGPASSRDTFMDSRASVMNEPNTEMGSSNPSPLVVASAVASHRTALWLIVAAVAVAMLVVLLVAGRRLPRARAPAPPVGSALGAIPAPVSSALGPLPPLVVPSSAAAAAEPRDGRTTAADSTDSGTNSAAGSRNDNASPARPAAVRSTPRAPTQKAGAAVVPKPSATNPMTYR